MRKSVTTRLLLIVLALLMPAVEFVATGCGAAVESHHDRAVEHGSHRATHDGTTQHAPVQPSADCPMKVPCRAPALQTALPSLSPVRLVVEARVDEAATIPLSIDRSSLEPPPRHSA